MKDGVLQQLRCVKNSAKSRALALDHGVGNFLVSLHLVMDIFPFLLKLHNFSASYLLNNRQRATVYLLSFAYSFFPAYCASNIVVANYFLPGEAQKIFKTANSVKISSFAWRVRQYYVRYITFCVCM